MSWKKIGETIADQAPLLGKILLGPAGSVAGELISSVFGTAPEPDAVLEAIKKDPESVLKFKEIELNHKVELEKIYLESERARLAAETQQIQEETKQLESVNQTMRVEAATEKWWVSGWRPYWGFISATAFFFVCLLACYLAYEAVMGKDPNAIMMVPNIIFAMTTLFGIPGAILGIASWHRGKKQRALAGEVVQDQRPLFSRIIKK